MKALFVLDMLHDGGAQTQALNLAHELSRHSIHTSATALYSPQGLSSHLGISTSGLGVSTNAIHFPLACRRLLNLCRFTSALFWQLWGCGDVYGCCRCCLF